jgi:hypothetical protein
MLRREAAYRCPPDLKGEASGPSASVEAQSRGWVRLRLLRRERAAVIAAVIADGGGCISAVAVLAG